jgi:hypothetical protein
MWMKNMVHKANGRKWECFCEHPWLILESKQQLITYSKDGFTKGKMMLQKSAGLGRRENVIPPGEVNISCEPRNVEIGWHPVGGFAGKWFAEKTGLGKMITEKVHKYPDPTQHWAVLVDDYCHELWMVSLSGS